MKKNLLITSAILALTACTAADRLSDVGKAPDMAPIENPTTTSSYRPVSMPMPAPRVVTREKNSLWGSDRQAFFKDQRAADVGDVLTVMIDIKDKAELDNETERNRSSSEDAGLNALLGYEQALDRILPQAVDNTNLAGADANSAYTGEGTIDRKKRLP
jgi:flagellar L-ring protein precursor FlgH